MAQYLNKDALITYIKSCISDIKISQKAGFIKKRDANNRIIFFKSILSFIDTIEVKEDIEHYELEEFAKIIRGNLTGIDKTVQTLFEAKYQQLTGHKMYGGYKD